MTSTTKHPSQRLRAALVAAAVLLATVAATAAQAADGTECAAPGAVETGFSRLWDGVSEPTETGWTQSGPGSFSVENDGADGCRLLSQGGLGLLWYSQREYTDYVLRLQWKGGDDADNSGVFVGFPDAGPQTHQAAISSGYEVQIKEGAANDEPQKTGSIYNSQRELQRAAKPTGQWNDYEIKVEHRATAAGVPVGSQPPLITATLNGTVVNVFQGSSLSRAVASGFLGLQNHGVNDFMSFRNLRIQNLRDTDAPITTATLDPVEADRDKGWRSGAVDVTLDATDAAGGTGIARTDYQVDGGGWKAYGNVEETILDGTAESFAKWKQAGPGQFVRTPDGVITSQGGMGLLWYPVRALGDVAITMEFRDARPGASANSGMFIRFPNPDEAAARAPENRYPCQIGSGQTQPTWVAVYCGQEIQIYDGASGEAQKTGSVYNFQPVNLAGAGVRPSGDWNTYEIQTVGGGDYTATIIRNGQVINTFQNTPGKLSSRTSDPGTDVRQFAEGYIGLQNHGTSDYIQFRNIRVRPLGAVKPVRISAPGAHTVEFRSTDGAGNVEAIQSVQVNIDGTGPTTTATVTQAAPGSPATVALTANDGPAGSGVASTEYRLDGAEWAPYVAPEQVLFDGTQESLSRWRQAPAGSFALQQDGSIQSVGGMGMLYYPEEFDDVALRFQFREARTDGGFSNSGAFMRFPNPDGSQAGPTGRYPCEPQGRPAWVAIGCGQEIQIYDGPTGEVQKTGSIYNLQPLNLAQAKATPAGVWNDYEIRAVGGGSYTMTVIRNGEVINTYVNTPGKRTSRAGDPPTDLRQYASGFIGLQNHSNADLIQIRNVRVQDLSPAAAVLSITAPGTHVIEFRSTDVAGNVGPVQQVTVTVS